MSSINSTCGFYFLTPLVARAHQFRTPNCWLAKGLVSFSKFRIVPLPTWPSGDDKIGRKHNRITAFWCLNIYQKHHSGSHKTLALIHVHNKLNYDTSNLFSLFTSFAMSKIYPRSLLGLAQRKATNWNLDLWLIRKLLHQSYTANFLIRYLQCFSKYLINCNISGKWHIKMACFNHPNGFHVFHSLLSAF